MAEQVKRKRHSIVRSILRRPARVAVASFLGVILLGTILLSLPWASSSGRSVGVVDAFFTATSGVCVTGLIVKDTPQDWSLFGQLVILTLIQAGGLGIMTVYGFLALMLRRRLSLGFERMMSDVVEARPEEGIWGTIRFICLLALIAETVGAVCLFFSWREDFSSFWQCLYFSIFHSISAFCNAGFSIFSDSLVRYRSHADVSLVICGLIVLGGLGFLVVRDLKGFFGWWLFARKGKRPRLSTHSKLVLTVTFLLLAVGFVGVYAMESATTLCDAPFKERVLAAVFQSVTPRTAGFNTIGLGSSVLAPSTALLLMVLMFVGGSPGSTAGGVKTTTIGVMIASILATLRGRDRAEMFHHSVPQETVHRVASIILLSVSVLVLGTFVLLITERSLIGRFGFLGVAFEATSAFGTVGLSMGVTPHLSILGRLIIPVMMFVGRLGPVTIMMSAAEADGTGSYQYPTGQIVVG